METLTTIIIWLAFIGTVAVLGAVGWCLHGDDVLDQERKRRA